MRIKLFVLLSLVLCSPLAFGKEWVYYVTEGDNLWDISKKYLKSPSLFKQVQQINQITYPKKMPPGTRIRIPLEWVKLFAAEVELIALNGTVLKIEGATNNKSQLNEKYKLGDQIQILAQSSATLRYADGSEMTVLGPATLGFDQLSHYGATGMVDTSVRLSSGTLEVRAKKAKGVGSRLDIQTASAITSVRGTVFRTSSVTENNVVRSSVEVLEGEVAVSSGNKQVDIPKGFGVVVAGEGNLAAPESLLPAPKSLTVPTEITTQHSNIQWSIVKDATHYQLLIAKDNLFSQIVLAKKLKSSDLALPALDDGQYFVRISAISQSGLIGLGVQAETIINTKPLPPYNVKDSSITHLNNDAIEWQHINGGPFRLQIAKQDIFQQPLVDIQINDHSFVLPDNIAVGHYYWRVAKIDNSERSILQRGPFSNTAKLSIKPYLTSPNIFIAMKDRVILGKWQLPSDNIQIELQTSHDLNFNNTKTIISAKNEVTLQIDAKVKQYLRGRFITKVGNHKGQWSGTCVIKPSRKFAKCGVVGSNL